MTRRLYPLAVALVGMPLATLAQSLLPNDKLTPGAIAEIDVSVVCQSGYARAHRHISRTLRISVFLRYGMNPDSGNYQLDHRVPLSLGGANNEENLWPEPYDTQQPWNARAKDRLEDRIHALVCSGKLTLHDGQAIFFGDWIEGYRRLFGEP